MSGELDLTRTEKKVRRLISLLRDAAAAAMDAMRQVASVRSQRIAEISAGYGPADQYRPASDSALQQAINAQSEAMREIEVVCGELVKCNGMIRTALTENDNRRRLLREDQTRLTRSPASQYKRGETELRAINTRCLGLLRLIGDAMQRARRVCAEVPSVPSGEEGTLERIVGPGRGSGRSAQGRDALVYGIGSEEQYRALDPGRYGDSQSKPAFADPALYHLPPDGYQKYTSLEQARRGGAIGPYVGNVSYDVPLPGHVHYIAVDSSSSAKGLYTVLDQYK